MNKKEIILNAINEKLGSDVVEIDMTENSPFYDSFIIVTAANSRNQEAIAEEIIDKLVEHELDYKKVEGKNTDWILVDANEFIVHIFLEETREKLRLEQLWQNVVKH